MASDSRNSTQQQQATIELALSLLESHSAKALALHQERLERLARKARADSAQDGAPIIGSVLSDDYLLGCILEFDGSLAFAQKCYNFTVGYESPLPLGKPELGVIKHFKGNKANILVCKRWKSMVADEEGRRQWKAQSRMRVEWDIEVAKRAAMDESLSWTARICAMAIADDASALGDAFRDVSDTSRGVGAALVEQRAKKHVKYVDEDGERFDPFIDPKFRPVPRRHPFFRLCRCKPSTEIYDERDQLWSFTNSIAYAAALVGSVQALRLLGSRDRFPLWKGHLLSLVKAALANPTLDGVVRSISALLSNQTIKGHDENVLHQRHYGCNGNHLHLAAARGHAQLTKALIEGGMNPRRRCEFINKRAYEYDDEYSDERDDIVHDERDRGVKQYPLPEHWASLRGHDEVLRIIHELSPRSHSNMSDGVKTGYAKRFNTERGFGFIRPDDGGKDIFVHISNIDDSIPLVEDECVEFTTRLW